MKKDNCPLCDETTFNFYITFCWTHKDKVLIVSTTHKKEFTEAEKEIIKSMFPDRNLRWFMKSIKDHAHCHIE